MLNIFKKDIRNAESVKCVSNTPPDSWDEVDCNSPNVSHSKVIVKVKDLSGVTQTYGWYQDANTVKRIKDLDPSQVNYQIPLDINIINNSFSLLFKNCSFDNCLVIVSIEGTTVGMPYIGESPQTIKKQVAVSTRNYKF